jgi:phage-related tail protein
MAIAPIPPPLQQAEPLEQKSFTKRPRQETIQQLHSCINAIIQFNNSSNTTHEQKWAINLCFLKKLGCSQRQIPNYPR